MSSEEEDDEEEFQPIATSTLRKKLRAQSKLQVKTEARDEMVEKLNSLSDRIWESAETIAEQDDRKQVYARDVDLAYQQILQPHNLLYQAVTKVDKIKWELKTVAEESPFSKDDELDD